MKRATLTCMILCTLAYGAFAWDYYGFIYDKPGPDVSFDIEGTVINVSPYGQVWLVIVNTTAIRDGFAEAGTVGLLLDAQPAGWNPGTWIKATAIFNETWEGENTLLPTFREVTWE